MRSTNLAKQLIVIDTYRPVFKLKCIIPFLVVKIITRKHGNCNALQLEVIRHQTSRLIMMPLPSLKSLNLSVALS